MRSIRASRCVVPIRENIVLFTDSLVIIVDPAPTSSLSSMNGARAGQALTAGAHEPEQIACMLHIWLYQTCTFGRPPRPSPSLKLTSSHLPVIPRFLSPRPPTLSPLATSRRHGRHLALSRALPKRWWRSAPRRVRCNLGHSQHQPSASSSSDAEEQGIPTPCPLKGITTPCFHIFHTACLSPTCLLRVCWLLCWQSRYVTIFTGSLWFRIRSKEADSVIATAKLL